MSKPEPVPTPPVRHPPLPVVYVERAYCPHCGGFRSSKYRSVVDAGDGSGIAWVRCLHPRCGKRYKIVML
jgi:hypothetical protein